MTAPITEGEPVDPSGERRRVSPPEEPTSASVPIILTANDLAQLIDRPGTTVLYLYHADWAEMNEDLGCDVCALFGECSVNRVATPFHEVDVPRVLASDDGTLIRALQGYGIEFDTPCVQVFRDREVIATVLRDRLPELREALDGAIGPI